jgi:putative DNA primase/helicase
MTLFDALAAANIPAPPAGAIPTTGGFIRWGENSRYWLKEKDGVALFGDWVTGESHHWFNDSGVPHSREETTLRNKRLADLCKEQQLEQERRHEEAAKLVFTQWNNLPENGRSPYVERKQVVDSGVRFDHDVVVIPLRDVEGKLWSLQHIQPDGTKRFTAGARKRGCFHTIGSIKDRVYVAEGYATAATVYMATDTPVVAAFDAGNIAPVVDALKQKHPRLEIIIAADDDCWKERNIGKEKAKEAAKKFGCKVVLPIFKDTSTKPTDFNDLHLLEGLDVVVQQLSESSDTKQLVAVTLEDFLNQNIAEREMLIDPIIPTQGLVMLYAARGIGKTYVSLSVALSAAAGGSTLGGKWKAKKPVKVLLVDGEMPAIVLQKRLAALIPKHFKDNSHDQ